MGDAFGHHLGVGYGIWDSAQSFGYDFPGHLLVRDVDGCAEGVEPERLALQVNGERLFLLLLPLELSGELEQAANMVVVDVGQNKGLEVRAVRLQAFQHRLEVLVGTGQSAVDEDKLGRGSAVLQDKTVATGGLEDVQLEHG